MSRGSDSLSLGLLPDYDGDLAVGSPATPFDTVTLLNSLDFQKGIEIYANTLNINGLDGADLFNVYTGPNIGRSIFIDGGLPTDRPISPSDVLATLYKHLRIDPSQNAINLQGRPIPLLPDGNPIDELF